MPNQSTCTRCSKLIFWFKSSKTQKFYPCNSTNHRDFHSCTPQSESPDRFKLLEDRVAALEAVLFNGQGT